MSASMAHTTAPLKKPDPIRHVVQLILENRSFDQMLGCMKEIYPDLDGVNPKAPYSNSDDEGRSYQQSPTTERQMLLDPHHEVPHVAVQLENGNSGFVRDFARSYPASGPEARQLIMSYFPLDFLPALHALGRNFLICDRWFASVPGPTWPNRFFALSGTSNGRVNMPDDGVRRADLPGYFQQTQTTLFDRLNEAAVDWKVYFHDVPQSTVLDKQRDPHNVARYFYIDQFYKDAHGPEADFPAYCLIEPDFMGYGQNDGHPPHDIMKAEKLIADIYNAIRANKALWDSMLLIVMFDEHGGFYDHVAPPAADPPDAEILEYSFNQLGVRVPAILVSPWVKRGWDNTRFDHTSVLKYLTDKWRLGPLGNRTAEANSIAVAIQDVCTETELQRIELSADQLVPPDLEAEDEAFGSATHHQSALKKLTEWLIIEADEQIPRRVAWLARLAEGLRGYADKLMSEGTNFDVSLARPDKLSLPLQTAATNNVVNFMVRMKRYAAIGLQKHLGTDLPPDQQSHSVQTLARIAGIPFHKQSDPVESAKAWLDRHGRSSGS